MTVTTLANAIYPIEYFTLAGVDTIQYPDTFWWSSRERFAVVDSLGHYLAAANGGTPTSEYLDIDLGRVRTVTYLNFDVIRAPLDITIEYDAVSSTDRSSVWVPVTRIPNRPYDTRIEFDGNNRTIWHNSDYVFTDALGNPVNTRFLRIGFVRRSDPWPLDSSTPFAWPVFVKHLRAGRAITAKQDSIGPLVIQDLTTPTLATLPTVDVNHTRQVRQQWVYPDNAQRGTVWPQVMGFGVLLQTNHDHGADEAQSFTPEVRWSIYDVTSPAAPALVIEGTHADTAATGQAWLDIYFDPSQYFRGDLTKRYELRISSDTPETFNSFYTMSPNSLSSRALPGTLSFTNNSTAVTSSQDLRTLVFVGDFVINTAYPDRPYSVSAITATTITLGTLYHEPTATTQTSALVFPLYQWNSNSNSYVADATQALATRIWADVAESGRDVLGNTYRYATRVNHAANVQDPVLAGWMSEPVPSADAVEALYFDVRTVDIDSTFQLTVLSALQIAPRTPGVRMNIYCTQQNLSGAVPRGVDEWDSLLWTPVANQSFILHRDEIIDFPSTIHAAFIKLEFTALNPLPYNLPNDPPLPPKSYRRFPTWVEDQFSNAQVRGVIQDWFVRNATPVQIRVLQTLADPTREFEYGEHLFLAALAQGEITDQQTINSGIVDVTAHALIDPVTASKVFVSDSTEYQGGLMLTVDSGSLLGGIVTNRRNPQLILDPLEASYSPPLLSTIPVVSNTAGRITESYQNLARLPMRFSQTCRHVYREEEGYFNKKGFFVGIQSVSFLRADFTVARDDPLIFDDLYDDAFLTVNTWQADATTSIPDLATIYVSYSVGNTDIVDEPILMTGTVEVPLSQQGGTARDLLVFSSPSGQGIQYFQQTDYVLSYQVQAGRLVNYIGRSAFGARLVAPAQVVDYRDGATVITHIIIPSPPSFDSATVTMHGLPVTMQEGIAPPSYGDGTYGGPGGTYGNLRSRGTDTGSVLLGHVISGLNTRTSTDAGSVTMAGLPSGTDIFTP